MADDVEMDELEAAYDENCLATIVRQKALLERAHAVITELLAYDARTMDLNKLSMLTGERTRESLAKAATYHARRYSLHDKLRFGVVTTGPATGALRLGNPLVGQPHVTKEMHSQATTHYLTSLLKKTPPKTDGS